MFNLKCAVTKNYDSGVPESFDTLTFFVGGSGWSDLLTASKSFRAKDLRCWAISRTGSVLFGNESTDCIPLIPF